MRMMLKVTIPTEAGNRIIKDGSFEKILEETMQRLKPEAAYFEADKGHRCALLFFDMKETWEMPKIAEPLFMGLNADLELTPVMNAEELRKGISEASKAK